MDKRHALENVRIPGHLPPEMDPATDLPNFDLHRVEQALRVNHVLYNGTPLSEAELQSGIEGYRQFLARHKAAGQPDQFEVPSYLVDRVWHAHMCETEQYAEDCMSYFGKMLHHRSGICNGGGDALDRSKPLPIESPLDTHRRLELLQHRGLAN